MDQFSAEIPQFQNLRTFFDDNPRVGIAFSGGCDSAFLLWAAVHSGAQVYAYTVRSQFQPAFEYEDAEKVAKLLGISIIPIEIDVLSDPVVTSNPSNRCYYCKRAIFSQIMQRAHEDGVEIVCDGTNASDDIADRPGFKTLQEFGVRSPLREAGLTKHLIRHLSALAELPTSAKPAYACLATRFPTGCELTAQGLKQIEQAESQLFSLGFSDFRVRYFHGAARIQFNQRDWHRATQMYEEIRAALRDIFSIILFDTETRA